MKDTTKRSILRTIHIVFTLPLIDCIWITQASRRPGIGLRGSA